MQISQSIAIPPLREDLQVFKGGYDLDGSPTWMLYDPISDNYYKIGWFEFECLQRFDQCKTSADLVRVIDAETTFDPEEDEVKEFIMFLFYCKLLRASSAEMQKLLYTEKERMAEEGSLIKKIFGKYLFITIPLFEPEAFLSKTYPLIKGLFTKQFLAFVLILLGVGLFLTLQRFDEFINTFGLFFSLNGIVSMILSTIFVKFIHELGHAYMAYKYKVPISTMGIVLIFFYPVLYTETTNAWRLHNRRKRINIAAAGLMAELSLASFFLILWHMLSPGLLQNISYFIAFVSLGLSFFVNMNFFMKFDGYYLLSDAIGVDNLQTRSIAFFKWKLRTLLIGIKDRIPEVTNDKMRDFLTLFGVSLIIYRILLYTGIAAVAYQFIFRPLGFYVMVAVLIWFLGLPVIKELIIWYQKKEEFLTNKRFKILIGLTALMLIIGVFPASHHVSIPVIAHAENYVALYPNFPSKVKEILVENGQLVEKGDTLFILSSYFIDNKITKTELELKLYNELKNRQEALPELASQNIDIEQVILESEIKLKGFTAQKEKLNVTAPFTGVIRDIPSEIQVGGWINQKNLLGRIIHQDSLFFTGYVKENDISRLSIGKQGKFLSHASLTQSIDVELVEISENNTNIIRYPELSSLYGGNIPSETSGGQQKQIRPLIPIYTVRFKNNDTSLDKINTIQRGVVITKAQPISFIGNSLKRLLSIFIRETGV